MKILELISKFDEALKNGYIKAFYQPLTRTVTGKVCGAEALARWLDPEFGLIPPGEFIGLLEQHGLIHRLDLAMIENVCRFYKKFDCRDMTFSVNLSRIDFKQTDMFSAITDIMKRYDVPVSAIHFEITESTMLADIENTRRLSKQFFDAGFEIWLDDFGSGYSSLSLLRDFRFNVLKMDMSLLKQFDVRSRKIVSSVVNMSKALGIHTLSEGVESEEQLVFLRNIGCEMIQGYYFSRPLCEEDFLAYLKEHAAETCSDRVFWNKAVKVNFLSGYPLMTSHDHSEEDGVFGTAPIALIEYENRKTTFRYVNAAYLSELKKLGYESIEQLDKDVNDENFAYYDRFMGYIEKTICKGGVFKTDSIIGDVVYNFTTELIASSGEKHLIASTVHTISAEHSDYLVLKYSQSLYATYDLVTEITPDKDTAVQIYSNAGFAKVYGTSSLRKGILEFAATEVHPADHERYLEFFDLATLSNGTSDYIQQSFKVRSGSGYKLKNIRISKLENGKYLYTIQSV